MPPTPCRPTASITGVVVLGSGGAVQIRSEPSSGRHSPAGGRSSGFSVSSWFMYILQSSWHDRAREARGSGCEAADLASSDELDHGLQRCHFMQQVGRRGGHQHRGVRRGPRDRRGCLGDVAMTPPPDDAPPRCQRGGACPLSSPSGAVRCPGGWSGQRRCSGRGFASGSHDAPPIGAGKCRSVCTSPAVSHGTGWSRRQQAEGAETVPSSRG